MSLSQTIRTKKGGFKKVPLTPLRAIKYHCLECNGGENPVKKDCLGKYCCLYPYRAGKNPEKKGIGVFNNIQK
jgi:hypothetical protein